MPVREGAQRSYRPGSKEIPPNGFKAIRALMASCHEIQIATRSTDILTMCEATLPFMLIKRFCPERHACSSLSECGSAASCARIKPRNGRRAATHEEMLREQLRNQLSGRKSQKWKPVMLRVASARAHFRNVSRIVGTQLTHNVSQAPIFSDN
jgi:hypothetical protein